MKSIRSNRKSPGRDLSMIASLVIALMPWNAPVAAGVVTQVSTISSESNQTWKSEPEATPIVKEPVGGVSGRPETSSASQPDSASIERPLQTTAVRKSNSTSIYFAYGSSQLTESAIEQIKGHAERLRANLRSTVVLVGFSEDYASTSFSIALGESRAKAVRDELLSFDVAASQIRTTSFGHEEYASSPCDTEMCRESYRRVEFRYTR